MAFMSRLRPLRDGTTRTEDPTTFKEASRTGCSRLEYAEETRS
jgi:hypothetical protein